MITYEEKVIKELEQWKATFMKDSSMMTRFSKSAEESATAHSGESTKSANRDDPDDGANDQRRVKLYKAEAKETTWSLQRRDDEVRKKWMSTKIAAAEGAGTGAGGILLGLADFPLLLGIKIKFLFDAATLYGFDTSKQEERLLSFTFSNSPFQVTITEKKYGKQLKRGIQKRKSYGLGKVPNRIPRLYRFSKNASARPGNRCPSRRICELSIAAKTWRSDDELLSYAIAE